MHITETMFVHKHYTQCTVYAAKFYLLYSHIGLIDINNGLRKLEPPCKTQLHTGHDGDTPTNSLINE